MGGPVARSVDPDRSADCHASGSVPTAAFAVNEHRELTLCAHHVGTYRGTLEAAGYVLIPWGKQTPGKGVGTEGTPNHYSLGTGT